MNGATPDLRTLFDDHHRSIYRFFLRLGAPGNEAEDLTQDVFLRALRVDHRRPVLRAAAWLFRIARNLWIDRLRHRRRWRVVESDRELDPADGDFAIGPHQALEVRLDQALGGLPEADRETFLLRELGGLGYDEIAAVTGHSPAAVRSRIFRARRALRHALAPTPEVPTREESP